jgi:bifunctional DNA-binding transcriptional regulator/antitoxin component of YhaV-PrlF toxin-antitoxin module
MAELTVTAKGQVTLRKDFLNHLGVQPGDSVSVNKLPNGAIEIRAARPSGRISDVFGSLKRPGQRRLSIKEIKRITEEAWAGKR